MPDRSKVGERTTNWLASVIYDASNKLVLQERLLEAHTKNEPITLTPEEAGLLVDWRVREKLEYRP